MTCIGVLNDAFRVLNNYFPFNQFLFDLLLRVWFQFIQSVNYDFHFLLFVI